MKYINDQFIEFNENLNSLIYEQNESKYDILKICELCGFHTIKSDYYNHIKYNCEYSNFLTCFNCFKNYKIDDYIKHKENICLKNIFNIRFEKDENKIYNLEMNVCYLRSELNDLKKKVNENSKNILELFERTKRNENELINLKYAFMNLKDDLRKLESKVENMKNELNDAKQNIKNMNSSISSLSNDIKNLRSDLSNLKDRANNFKTY